MNLSLNEDSSLLDPVVVHLKQALEKASKLSSSSSEAALLAQGIEKLIRRVQAKKKGPALCTGRAR